METFDVGSHYNTINGSILKVIEVRDTIVAFGAVSLAEEDTELGNQMCYGPVWFSRFDGGCVSAAIFDNRHMPILLDMRWPVETNEEPDTSVLMAIPDHTHWAIITESVSSVKYLTYTDRREWEQNIKRLDEEGVAFKAMVVSPASFEKKFIVHVAP